MSGGGWRFWIDRGGTFTDLVARSPEGELVVRKFLSEQPERPGDPAIRALRGCLGLEDGSALPPGLVEEVRLGTTVATNALLERRVEPVLLLVNRGLADLPRIGDQHRPDIFALHIQRPLPLVMTVLEVGGRLSAAGEEVEPLVLDAALEQGVRSAFAAGCRSCAVALLHSYRHPSHERRLGAWLEQLGLGPVLLSHAVSRQPRLVPRLHTTLVEAALRPVLGRYLDQVRGALGPGTRLRVMTSAGALRAPELLQAKDTILSGPAGGMVGAVAAARAAGLGDRPILGFDMGGTSTDVFHWEGDEAGEGDAQDPTGERGETGWERSSETEIAGLRLQAAMLPIHTVAAGGGSVLQAESGRLRVGPRSAGADPGPACYRRGGPLTVTDANLLLGRLPADALPAVFGPGGDQPADGAVVRRRFEDLAAALVGPGGPPPAPAAVAQGALAIAVERMAEAIRRISIQRGHDIRRAVLVSFGGAGGQHACRLAETLGIERVLLHPLAGVLSAYGIGLSRQALLLERPVRTPLTPDLLPRLQHLAEVLAREAVEALRASGDLPGPALPRPLVRLELRYPASDRGLEVSWPGPGAPGSDEVTGLPRPEGLREAFEALHRRRFGYAVAGEPLVVERLLVEVVAPAPADDRGASPAPLRPSAQDPGPRRDPSARNGAVDRCSAVGGAAGCRWVPLCLPVSAPEAAAAATAAAAAVGATSAEGAGGSVAGGGMEWRQVPLWRREDLMVGQEVQGPALVVEATGTTVVDPHWRAVVLTAGDLLLEPTRAPGPTAGTGPATASEVSGAAAGPAAAAPAAAPEPTQAVDPMRLELYHHRFSAIAEQMGVRLQQSSRSVNIRERLDFSCALFDAAGRLVANAPHIPVHLGSMGESVAGLLAAVARGDHPPLRPGDAVAANNPFDGGTHLPDITVITPVFGGSDPQAGPAGPLAGGPLSEEPLFFVASRGHHADVGGITPGSMPPFSHRIEEEGLLLDNVPVLQDGVFDEEAWRRRLAAGPHPVRNPDQLLADLQAQVAANRLGTEELQRLLRRQGVVEVRAYMAHVQAHAAEAVRQVIDRLQDGGHAVALDDGGRIQVRVVIDRTGRRVRVDFTGTSPQQGGNANAPLAITKAAVLYVFRCLVGQPIPLNAGCFEPIDLVVPRGSLLHPAPPAAVVAGNVETSQAVVNALFGALGVMAAAQGTMNNFSFGDARSQYYETICGGTGAGLLPDGTGFDGADAVQSHMTNSRLTDPEILEDRFAVRLERFAIRRGSGGAGRWRGGEGVERTLTFLAPMTAAILSGSRRVPPFGLAGGGPGAVGRNRLERADGRIEDLPGRVELRVAPGDRLHIETPGGGGYGLAEAAAPAPGGAMAGAVRGAIPRGQLPPDGPPPLPSEAPQSDGFPPLRPRPHGET